MRYNILRNIDRAISVLERWGLHGFKRTTRNLLDRFLTKGISIEVDRHIISGSLRHITFLCTLKEGRFEPSTVKLFTQVVKPGMVVLDIGSYIGYYTLLAARQVGHRGKVYAFEPDPHNYFFLNQNIHLNNYTNVVTVPKTVSNQSSIVKLYLNSNDDSSKTSLFFRKGLKEVISVECTTVDEIIGNQRVDVAKLDIEGGELFALEGMRRTLERNPHLILFVELNPSLLQEAGSTSNMFKNMLRDLGYNNIIAVDEMKNTNGELLALNLYCRR